MDPKHDSSAETTSPEIPAVEAVGSVDPGAEQAAPESVRDEIIEAVRTVFDPEIPVNIYDMGLIYEIDVKQGGQTYVRMTLTSPMCPVAETLPPEVEAKVRAVPGVSEVELELVWEPPWDMAMMSEAARLELGM